MGKWNRIAIVSGVILAVAGIASAATNPSQTQYEEFATETLTAYLKQNLCTEAPKEFNLQKRCQELVRDNQSQLRDVIARGTEQQNFIFFSIYTTDLSPSTYLPSFAASFLPSYHFQTVGLFQQFHIYQAERK